jgi:hypothetical protein
MEGGIAVEHRLSALDLALKYSPSRWWDTHKETLTTWDEVNIAMHHRFLPPTQIPQLGQDRNKNIMLLSLKIYGGKSNLFIHIEHYLQVLKDAKLPYSLWTHHLFHSL